MDIKRYIVIQGVLLKDKSIVPIWDSRIKFEKTEMVGNRIEVEGERDYFHSVVECVFDLKTKQIFPGINVDVYPNLPNLKHKIGNIVLFEYGSKNVLTKIVDIVFENYDLSITKGKKIEEWELSRLPKDLVVDRDSMYAIKYWKPTYILENGKKTEYDMYLRLIENLDYLSK